MIDDQGYLKMIDFGLSRVMEQQKKAYTNCGSPMYMAPELFTNNGHGYTADYWSVGVLLYEMLAGTVPFVNNQSAEAVKTIIFPSMKTNPSAEQFRDIVK